LHPLPLPALAEARARIGHAALLLVLAAAVFASAGHYYGAGPDYTYLLGGLRLADPALLRRDWFSNLPTYTPTFALLAAALSRILPMPVAWALLHALAVLVVLFAAASVLRRLGMGPTALVLFVVAGLRWDSKLIGGHAFWFNEVHPQALAQAALVAAIAAYLLGRPRAAAAAAGVGTLLHPPMGLALGGLLALGTLRERRRHRGGDLVQAGVLFVLLSLPAVLYLATFERDAGPAPPGTFLAMARMRLPHHFFPSTWPLEGWCGLGAVVALFFASLPELADREVVDRSRLLVIGLLGLLGASFVLVEIWPVTLFAKFQFARLTVFLRFLCVLAASVSMARGLCSPVSARAVQSLALLSAVRGPHLAALAVLVSSSRITSPIARKALFGIGAVALLAALAWQSAGGLLVLFPLLALLDALLRRSGWAERRSGILAAACLAVLFGLWAKQMDPAFRLEWTGPRSEFARAGDWIRAHTPPDALFLSPPALGGFCFFSRRATVVDFHRNPFSEAAIVEWRRRLADLIDEPALDCLGLRECNRILEEFNTLPVASYEKLAARYGAEYLLVRSRDDLSLRRLYRNRGFDVYALPGAGS
jgi:hypothetical protein